MMEYQDIFTTLVMIGFALSLAKLQSTRIRLRILEQEQKLAAKQAYKAKLYEDDRVQMGPENLSVWFGLSRSSWAVLPRVLMQAMPPRWQADMASLLMQLDAEFPGSPMDKLDFHVQAKANGKFAQVPEALTDYRHPKKHVLQTWRQSWKP